MLILTSGLIQLPQSSQQEVQVLEGSAQSWLRYLCVDSLKTGFSLSVKISYHAQSILSDLSGNGSEGFGSLWLSWSLSPVPAHFLASFLCLLSTVLCLAPGTATRMFAPEKCYTTSAWPFSQVTSCSFSQCVNTDSPWLLPAILACYYQQSLPGSTVIQLLVFDKFAPYLLSFYKLIDCADTKK